MPASIRERWHRAALPGCAVRRARRVPPCRHTPAPRSPRWITTALLLPVALLVACGRDTPPPSDPPPQLRTVRRMIDEGMRPEGDPRLTRGDEVFLGDEARPVLAAAKPLPPALRCAPAARGEKSACVAEFPSASLDAPAALLVRRARVPAPPGEQPGAASDAPAPSPATADPADTRWEVLLLAPGESIPAGDLDGIDHLVARTLAAPALRDRSRSAEPFVVPPNAWLRLSIGVEPAAWWIDSAPVLFRVELQDEGGATYDLVRRVLDPAHRALDRRWFDVDVDLSILAGTTARLRFVTEPAERDDTRPSLPLWGDPRIVAPVAERRPSIVLISLDTLRAKSMSAYGYALETTPRMSALAATGALFENAFTTYSNTLPAHMSMLTGLYPATHGVISFGQQLASGHATLAELLRGAGYGTAAFTENALLDARHGFPRGFSTYDENTRVRKGAGDVEHTFGRALEWAGRHADESFFLFVHTYEVHWPYDPPESYRKLFTGAGGGHVDEQQRAYDQAIRYTDDVLQRFVDGLRRIVPEQDLVIVVTSDHGEEFYDHGLFTHHQLYDEVMRVPLILVARGRIPPGVRVATPVSLVDVPPTLLALAGVAEPQGLDGRSLLPLVGDAPATLERGAVFGEFPKSALVHEHHFVARSADAKCMLGETGTRDVCFDLRADPAEREPRPSDTTDAFRALRLQLDGYRTRALASRTAPGTSLLPKPTPAPASAPQASADAAQATGAAPDDARDPVERKLRALGYVE